MNLSSLNKLVRDINQDNLYNFIVFDFTPNIDVTFYTFDVRVEHEMRIDLVSVEIFKSDDYVDFLCNLNDIDNPLNIKEGDTILYCKIEDIDTFTIEDVQSSIQSGQYYLNPDKSSKKDPNRVKYLEDGYTLSPVMKTSPSPSVKISDNKIIISK